jgi:cell division transport system permease protein
MRALAYAFSEAAGSLWRGQPSRLLSVGTIIVALFVFGALLLLTSNLDRLTADWSRAAELSVYLKDGAEADDRAAIERLLAPGTVVDRYEYVSKEQAIGRFKEMFSDLAATVDGLETNPLPASYEVTLREGAGAQAAIDRLAVVLKAASGVSDVRYDREWLVRLRAAVRGLRIAGLVLGAILSLAAAVTVASVVRLALDGRRDELEIMQLVGAPRFYIRGPIVAEGILQGGLGALAALALLKIAFVVSWPRLLEATAGTIDLSAVRFLPLGVSLLLVAGGMVVGLFGGLIAATGAHGRL